jgi:hypothetical protein
MWLVNRGLPFAALLLLVLACSCMKRPTLEPLEPGPEPVWNSLPMLPSQLLSEFRTSPGSGAQKYRRALVRVFGHISSLEAGGESSQQALGLGDTPEAAPEERVHCLVAPEVAARLSVGLPVTVLGHPVLAKGAGLELTRCVLESVARE